MESDTIYYMITNQEEKFGEYQLKTGLNIFDEKHFIKYTTPYFLNIEDIFQYVGDGSIYLREITLPKENENFVVSVIYKKYYANMVILGTRYELSNEATFKLLVANTTIINVLDYQVLHWCCHKGFIDIVKYLVSLPEQLRPPWSVSQGADIHAYDDNLLHISAKSGRIDIVRFLIESGANIHTKNNSALIASATNGHIDIIRYLVESGANIHAANDKALTRSANNGHIDVVRYLVESGADINASDNFTLILSACKGHKDIVSYLIRQEPILVQKIIKF